MPKDIENAVNKVIYDAIQEAGDKCGINLLDEYDMLIDYDAEIDIFKIKPID